MHSRLHGRIADIDTQPNRWRLPLVDARGREKVGDARAVRRIVLPNGRCRLEILPFRRWGVNGADRSSQLGGVNANYRTGNKSSIGCGGSAIRNRLKSGGAVGDNHALHVVMTKLQA